MNVASFTDILFSQNQRRRQGNSGSRRPITSSQLHYSDTAARRPINTASSASSRHRPQQKSSSRKRPRPAGKAQNRQQLPTGSPRPVIPLFLRPPRPARPGVTQQHAKTVPVHQPPAGGDSSFLFIPTSLCTKVISGWMRPRLISVSCPL